MVQFHGEGSSFDEIQLEIGRLVMLLSYWNHLEGNWLLRCARWENGYFRDAWMRWVFVNEPLTSETPELTKIWLHELLQTRVGMVGLLSFISAGPFAVYACQTLPCFTLTNQSLNVPSRIDIRDLENQSSLGSRHEPMKRMHPLLLFRIKYRNGRSNVTSIGSFMSIQQG